VADFCSYAKICFDRFGDRVDHWLTFNEPWCIAAHGHGDGKFAPYVHSVAAGLVHELKYTSGVHSDTEPWTVGHSVIVAHAHVSAMYRAQFPLGKIGITLNADWAEPYDENPESELHCSHKSHRGPMLTFNLDVKAAQDKMDAHLGWFADPVYLGRYPESMVNRLGDRLPKFTDEELALLPGSSMVSQSCARTY